VVNLRAEYHRAYYLANRERILQRNRDWREANPGYFKAYYQANREHLDPMNMAWTAEHPEWKKQYDREYRLKNKERERERIRAWETANPERKATRERNRNARKRAAGGFHTVEDIETIYAVQRGHCFWCDAEVGDNYHVDHLVPVVAGGSNGPENLVIACPMCNQRKHSRDPLEFLEERLALN